MEDSPVKFNKWAFEPIVREKYNVLRARLLNLCETVARDSQQAEALKGLVKDFCNQAYFPTIRELEGYIKSFGWIDEKEGRNSIESLETQGLKDVLVS